MNKKVTINSLRLCVLVIIGILKSFCLIVIESEIAKGILESILLSNKKRVICLFINMLFMLFFNILIDTLTIKLRFKLNAAENHQVEQQILYHISNAKSLSDKTYKSESIPKIVNDVSQYVSMKYSLIENCFCALSSVLFAFFYCLHIDWICTITNTFIIMAIYLLLRKNYVAMSQMENDIAQKHNNIYSYIWEIIENKEVSSFLYTKKILRSFVRNSSEIADYSKQKSSIYAKVSLGKNLINTGILIVVGLCVSISYLLFNKKTAIPDVLVLFIVIPQMANALGSIFSIYSQHEVFKGLKKRLMSIQDIVLYDYKGKINIPNIKSIQCYDVKFGYSDNKLILNNVNLIASSGESILIAGESGKGKSTFIKILLGLITDYSGSIKVDGVELSSINRKSIWNICSYISQDVVLLNGSIKNNIILNYEYDKEKFDYLIQLVGLDYIIERCVDKENAMIDQLNLSSGEQQRLLIARALYNSQLKYLVMDEATSAMDPAFEHRILGDIKEYVRKNNIIWIWISHNKKLVKYADKVVEL